MTGKRRSLPRRFHAWAVEKDFDWGCALLGRFAFGHEVPSQFRGCVTALFETRKAARAAAALQRAAALRYGSKHPGARAVQVVVTLRRAR